MRKNERKFLFSLSFLVFSCFTEAGLFASINKIDTTKKLNSNEISNEYTVKQASESSETSEQIIENLNDEVNVSENTHNQIDESSEVATWAIYKNEKLHRGPFSSKMQVLATWHKEKIKEGKNFYIYKNDSKYTNTPSKSFKKELEEINDNVKRNGKKAYEKYFEEPSEKLENNDEKIENSKNFSAQVPEFNYGIKYESQNELKPESKKEEKVAEESKQEIKIVPETKIKQEKKNEEKSEPKTEPKIEPKSEPKTEIKSEPKTEIKSEQKVEQPVKKENKDNAKNTEKITEPVTEAPKIGEKEITFEIPQLEVKRYKKEYLQDFIPVENPQYYEDDESEEKSLKIENPEETDNFGRTLLMNAAKSGNEWEIKQLIAAGARINTKDKDGWTALMYAVRYQENLSTVDVLIDAGADIWCEDNYGNTALMIASCYNNNPQILKTLLRFYDSSSNEVLKSFILLITTNNSNDFTQISKMKIFIKNATPVNSFYRGKTPLMYAAEFSSSTKVLKLLLDNDAITTLHSTEGFTAFDYAKKNRNLEHDEIFWSLNKR